MSRSSEASTTVESSGRDAGARHFSCALALLALRRALHPFAIAWSVFVGFVLASSDMNVALLELDAGDPARALVRASGLMRQGLWSGFCLAILPLFFARACGVVGRWRASGEVDWLASRALPPRAILASTVAGTLCAAWLATLAWWAFVAVRTPAPSEGLQPRGTLAAPGGEWIDAEHPRSWRVALPEAANLRSPSLREPSVHGARVEIELGLGAGAGPAAAVTLRAKSDDATTASRTHIATRGRVEVALPASRGEIELTLSVDDPDARFFVISDRARVWMPVSSSGAADRAIALRLGLAGLAWLSLAIAFGAWVNGATAGLGVAALWIAVWTSDATPTWIPGADLIDALAIVGSGRVPAPIDLRSAAFAVLLALGALWLAVAGVARWRRET